MAEPNELEEILGTEEEEIETKTEEEAEVKTEVEETKKESFEIPEKFKGKSVEEIVKSYMELEKLIERKSNDRAREILAQMREKGEEEELKETKTTFPTIEGKVDFASMTPDEFAEWMLQQVDKRAEEKARRIFEENLRIKDSVTAEIAEAQEKHPLLKTNDEYRELVLTIIEAAASKGEIVSLEEACQKVDAVIGRNEEIGKEEREKLKKAKAIVEKGSGTPVVGTPETEEERIKEALLGSKINSPLGGLGV